MEPKVEKITLEDGRSAERHIWEDANETVVELHVEPERPKFLHKRVVEKKRPMVYERKVETVNQDGEIVEQVVESTNEPKLTLKEHIGLINNAGVAAQSFEQPTNDCVSRDELETILEKYAAMTKEGILTATKKLAEKDEPMKVSAYQVEVGEKVAEQSGLSTAEKLGYTIVAVLLAAVAYVGFVM